MMRDKIFRAGLIVAAAACCSLATVSRPAAGGTPRERLGARLVDRAGRKMIETGASGIKAVLPAGSRVLRDVAYGKDRRQRFDVYIPPDAKNAPVIFMVHGGAWAIGDKAMPAVVVNKVARWLPRGYIFVSADYRMLPDADPVEQARDVAAAIARAQDQAESWGGDPNKFILMGHSAGAHLVALVATDPALSAGVVKTPWRGTVCLDSGAYDVAEIMGKKHLPLYDKAFGGRGEAYWRAASPYDALQKGTRPILAVCSIRRPDSPEQAREFARKAWSLGVKVTVVEEDYSHGDINARLGEDGPYTRTVEAFMNGLLGK